MALAKIISISGKPGLYKVIGQTKNGVIVEGVEDGKRFPAFASQQISAMSDISIFTSDDDKPLIEVLESIFKVTEGKEVTILNSDSADIISYFEKALPNFDKERVYVSDIKKVFKWYNLLLSKNLINAESFATEAKEESDTKTDVVEKTKKNTKSAAKLDKAKVSIPKTNTKGKAAKTSVVRKAQ